MTIKPSRAALNLAALLTLAELHGPQGQRIDINPPEITSVREPTSADLKRFARGTRCIVVMVDGKFIAVVETCDRVRSLIGAAP